MKRNFIESFGALLKFVKKLTDNRVRMAFSSPHITTSCADRRGKENLLLDAGK